MRLGHLGSSHPNGAGFKPDDVCRVMNELWVDYVASNPKLLAVGGVRKATNETLLELKLNRDAGFHPHYAWLVRQVYEGIMSSNQKGNASIAIALVAWSSRLGPVPQLAQGLFGSNDRGTDGWMRLPDRAGLKLKAKLR